MAQLLVQCTSDRGLVDTVGSIPPRGYSYKYEKLAISHFLKVAVTFVW